MNNYCELFWTAKITLVDLIKEMEEFLNNNLIYKNPNHSIFNLFNLILKNNNKHFIIMIVFLIGILFRILVGFGNYSGCNDPPNFGDYEA